MMGEFGFQQKSKIKNCLTYMYNGKIILRETEKTD